jgi:hypothetical protein
MYDGNFDGNGQAYSRSQCVPDDSCYVLVVHDSFGDGMDATGGYSVAWDGTVVVASSSSGFQGQWANHNINCGANDGPGGSGGGGGSTSTAVSRHRACPTELVLNLVVIPDAPGAPPTSFFLIDVDSGAFVWNESDLPPHQALHYSTCLKPDTCMNLVILDNGGGLSGHGHLLLTYAGEEVHPSSGTGPEYIFTFGC